MASVDLNADVGEGAATAEDESRLLDVVTSASIACGAHAGDLPTMRLAVEAAVRRGVVVGAHPSYDDREGFGRRAMEVDPAALVTVVEAQIGALDDVARAGGTRVRYVKAHGALYHAMSSDPATAVAVLEAMGGFDGLVLLAPAGSPAIGVARARGVEVAVEAFADRSYAPDGALVSRLDPGAVVTDPDVAAGRALTLALEGRVAAADGTILALHPRPTSICVHGDSPGALEIARHVRDALGAAGVGLSAFVP